MTKNLGNVDRIIRALVGIGLLAIVFVGPQTPWGWLGLIPLATSIVGFCPVCALLGINCGRVRG